MPQPCFHLHLAETLLHRWSESTVPPPFSPDKSANRAAFMHGSLAPDMGFFPGTPRLLSELAHSSRSGDLTRALLRHAQTEPEVAFAYGWATHILVDAHVHPLVNATAEKLLGSPPNLARAARDHMHIRLEIGLDLLVHRKQRHLRRVRLPALFDRAGLRFLGRAIAEIHGVTVLPDVLLASHRRVALLTPPLLTLQATMSACIPPVTAPVPFVQSVKIGLGTLQTVASYMGGPGNSTVAFLSPVYPPDDFVMKVDDAVAQFNRAFQRQVDHGLASLPNYNLETGEIEEELVSPVGVTAVA